MVHCVVMTKTVQKKQSEDKEDQNIKNEKKYLFNPKKNPHFTASSCSFHIFCRLRLSGGSVDMESCKANTQFEFRS